MNKSDFRSVFFLFLVFFTGCAPLNRISNRDMALLYNPDKETLFPQYLVYNITDSSTRLFLKIKSENILYMQSPVGQYRSDVRLNCRIFPGFETDRYADTCSLVLEDVQSDNESHALIKYVDFKTPAVKEYVLELMLTDFNRHTTQKSYLTVNNKSLQSPINYLIVNAKDSVPLFTSSLSSTTDFSILCRKKINTKIYVRYFMRKFPLSAPAFKVIDFNKFNYRSDETYSIDLEKNNTFNFKNQGIYHLQSDSTILDGLTLFRFSDDYPRQTQAFELVEPLRYLTTSREFNKIINSTDKKAAIDDFWLDIAGNKTKGRELIKVFYSRVEAANKYFTSYHEGWKTDRGMIYIIFGEPNVVYRSSHNEDWNYSGSFEHGPVNFTFEKIDNPFTGNDYNLQRSLNYESIWFMAVEAWRQGRQMDLE